MAAVSVLVFKQKPHRVWILCRRKSYLEPKSTFIKHRTNFRPAVKKIDWTLCSQETVQYIRSVYAELGLAGRLNFRTVKVIPCERCERMNFKPKCCSCLHDEKISSDSFLIHLREKLSTQKEKAFENINSTSFENTSLPLNISFNMLLRPVYKLSCCWCSFCFYCSSIIITIIIVIIFFPYPLL